MPDKSEGTPPRKKRDPPSPPQRPSSSPRGPPPPVQPRRPTTSGQASSSRNAVNTASTLSLEADAQRPLQNVAMLNLNQQNITGSSNLARTYSDQNTLQPSIADKKEESHGRFRNFFKRKKQQADQDDSHDRISDHPPHLKHINPNTTIKVKTSRILYTTDEEVRDALMEFAIFIIFLILTTLVSLSIRHSYMFYFNDTMTKLFATREVIISPSVTLSFEKVVTVPDFWDYLVFNFLVTLHGDMKVIDTSGVTIDSTQPGGSEDGEPGNNITDTGPGDFPVNETDPGTTDAGDDGTTGPNDGATTDAGPVGPGRNRRKINSKNRIKKPRSHEEGSKNKRKRLQGRVFLHENLLLGPPRLRQVRVRKDSCYVNDAFIRYFNTCYAPYSAGAEEINIQHGGATYKTKNELEATAIWTILHFYSTGGYTVELTYDKEKNLEIIKKLKNTQWIDRGTRLCLVEFNLYNENTDTFQSIKLIAEVPATGGVIPQAQLMTVKQFSFITDKSLTMSVIYIFWYIMIIYYNIYEFNEIRKSGLKNYAKSLLNILDALILLLCYVALVYNVWHTLKIKSLVTNTKFEEKYHSLDMLCFWNVLYVDMMAILSFLVWIKIFKFISFNKTLVQFTTTLRRCSKDLAGFSLMFGIVFLAYAQLGLLLFGTKHPDFRNFITSVLTMIRMILGDFQYKLIEQANRVLGPIYFLTYILLVFFILLNMFLAIIMETYNSVKSEITQGRSQLGAYIYRKLSGALFYITHCGRKRPARDLSQNREPEPVKEDVPVQPANVNLRRNMTEAEAHYFDDIPQSVRNKDLYRLSNRVSLLEEILEQLVTNMDGILKRVEREVKRNK